MNDWKRTGLRSYYGKKVHEAVMAANATKQQLWEARLVVGLCAHVSPAQRLIAV